MTSQDLISDLEDARDIVRDADRELPEPLSLDTATHDIEETIEALERIQR